MDLRQLRMFIAAVEHGSVTRAAEALCMPQPGLRLHLELLAHDLGATLLVIDEHGVKPTAAGEILLEDARALVRQFEATRTKIERLSP